MSGLYAFPCIVLVPLKSYVKCVLQLNRDYLRYVVLYRTSSSLTLQYLLQFPLKAWYTLQWACLVSRRMQCTAPLLPPRRLLRFLSPSFVTVVSFVEEMYASDTLASSTNRTSLWLVVRTVVVIAFFLNLSSFSLRPMPIFYCRLYRLEQFQACLRE